MLTGKAGARSGITGPKLKLKVEGGTGWRRGKRGWGRTDDSEDGVAAIILRTSDAIHALEVLLHRVEDTINGHADVIQSLVVIINGLADAIYGHVGTILAPEGVIHARADFIHEVEDLENRLTDLIQRVAVSKWAQSGVVLRQAAGPKPTAVSFRGRKALDQARVGVHCYFFSPSNSASCGSMASAHI